MEDGDDAPPRVNRINDTVDVGLAAIKQMAQFFIFRRKRYYWFNF
jgi:hypothetical protein